MSHHEPMRFSNFSSQASILGFLSGAVRIAHIQTSATFHSIAPIVPTPHVARTFLSMIAWLLSCPEEPSHVRCGAQRTRVATRWFTTETS